MEDLMSNFRSSARLRAVFILGLVLVVGLGCTTASAQTEGSWQLFGGYSYVRAETEPQLEPFGLGHINANGWEASVTNYPWQWFGATVDVSGFYTNPTLHIPANYFGPGLPPSNESVGNLIHTSAYTLMFGPSVAYRKNRAVQPFAHFLLGGVYGKASLTGKGQALLGSSFATSEWVFGYALGGGADVRITDKVAIRGQGDWIRSSFQNLNNDRQNNMRFSVGVVYRW
jgi:opacity protein-like surface antigen